MAINLSSIELNIAALAKNLDSASDRLLLAKILSKIRQGSVAVVGSTSKLPDISTVVDGELYFVEADGAIYVAQTTLKSWKPLSKDYFGYVLSWGNGGNGRLGDNSTVSKSSPVSIVSCFTDWCQVSAGRGISVAIRTDGTIWTWGIASSGTLGDNSSVSKSSPVSVVGGFTDWCQISAGDSHMAAIRTNGTAWSWGLGGNGRLGNYSATNMSSPVSVVGGFTDWCQVSAGCSHTLAVRTNGTAWSWGSGTNGALGDNTTVSKSSPVSVVGGFTDWCQVSAGTGFSAGLRTNGTVWAWGWNNCGQLGDFTTINKSSPVSVVGGFTDWCQISVGHKGSAAIRTNGTLWVWGSANCGGLGDNTAVPKSSPVSVVGGFTDWCQVSVGYYSTSSVRTNGTAWVWGFNAYGKLGDNTTSNKSSPVSVVGGFANWSQVSTGSTHSIGLIKKTF